jgi:hypothetical protein
MFSRTSACSFSGNCDSEQFNYIEGHNTSRGEKGAVGHGGEEWAGQHAGS